MSMTVPATVVMPTLLTRPWQLPMTACALQTLRVTTEVPFDIVVVDSTDSQYKDDLRSVCNQVNAHLVEGSVKGLASFDINRGINRAKTDRVVYMGNDIFVRDQWLEALLECFDQPRCGIATLASFDLITTPAAVYFGQSVIREGIYGPLMMFDRSWQLDEVMFPCQFADSDLIMRIYMQGLRSYRNNRVIIQHLNRQTINGPEHDEASMAAKRRFEGLYHRRPELVYRILVDGWIV